MATEHLYGAVVPAQGDRHAELTARSGEKVEDLRAWAEDADSLRQLGTIIVKRAVPVVRIGAEDGCADVHG
jgi:hypothetical protein